MKFKAKDKKISKKMQQTIKRQKEEHGYVELDISRDLPIKKAMSAYVLFGNEIRQKISDEDPDGKNGLRVTDIVCMIASKWKLMSKAQKQPYNDLAKQDQQRFDTELKQICGLRKEEELEANGLAQPKKPMTPYMLFVK